MLKSIDVGELSRQTPDLDDVFLSLTGDHERTEGGRPMTAYALVLTDSATMLRRNLRRMRRYPSLTIFIAGIPVVFLLLFVYVFGGTLGAGLGPVCRRSRRLHRVRRSRDPADHGRRRGAGDGHLGRHGHDRGHHRPVQDDGYRARRRSWPATSSAASSRRCWRSRSSWSSPSLIGFRPTTGPIEWLAATGVLALTAFAVTWLGRRARDGPQAASRPRATRRCSWCSCRSSAAASSRPSRCRTA